MKLIKMASGQSKIKISKKEWTNIGRKAKWIIAQEMGDYYEKPQRKPLTELDVVQAIKTCDDIKECLENGNEDCARDFLKLLNNIIK